jgi:hypothetical protein
LAIEMPQQPAPLESGQVLFIKAGLPLLLEVR